MGHAAAQATARAATSITARRHEYIIQLVNDSLMHWPWNLPFMSMVI